MNRRRFMRNTLGASVFLIKPALAAQSPTQNDPVEFTTHGGLVIERPVTGKPHAGKVLAAIQPHSDDIPIFAAGTVAKLLNEGYTGYLIRVTNDDMAGPGSIGDTVLANEVDNNAVARVLGLQKVFDLNYGNHMMDAISRSELRSRLIFLFRLLKVDTIVCYDPWAHYDENPDHYIAAHCVEAACWMAGGREGLSGTLCCRLEASCRSREVLFCALPATRKPRRGYQYDGRTKDRCAIGEQGAGTRR